MAIVLLGLGLSSALAESREFSFGVTPQFDHRRTAAVWQPILDELGRRTGQRFVLTGVPGQDEFHAAVLRGTHDFVYANPYYTMLALKQQQYRVLVRDYGQPLYGVLVVRRDSGYQSPGELAGKTIAFPSPNALGASLMLRADLARHFKLHFSPHYVQSHSSVYLNVAQRLAEAGGGVQKTLEVQPEAIRSQLRVIHKTQEIPPHPVMAHVRVPAELRAKIRTALIEMSASDAGRALLAEVPFHDLRAARDQDYLALDRLGLAPFFVEGGRP